ncbi:hypothetical protein O6H91_15G077700 [Diphasiastrum complanatum]|uniref:Uncharacterized protein n=1 Tax=Diphasiastrum complanatum TaxID=34168 RepID=A0ACC2BK00_DIPCM|nr:hypothetical protein O6H91_15G077700 [Diphasiastrum complanatum]
MVILHVKQTNERQFLYECSSLESLDCVIRELVVINNLQLRILHLTEECEQLAQYGPCKPRSGDLDEGEDSEDEDGATPTSSAKDRGPFYKRDPSHRRTGEACDPAVAEILTKTIDETNVCVSKDKVLYKAPLTSRMLKEHIQNIKGAIMMCYPMGLPSHDSVQQELKGTCEAKESLNPLTTQLWWAGKELAKERRLCDHVGKNEKTKIIVKLQEKGHGPPQREPPIDAETQKAMMAWYYKQQQEQKKLYEDEDDSYANSEWANPKALKSHFQGTTHIQYR